MVSLTSCAKTNSNLIKISLPEMPLASAKVGDELLLVCNNNQCPHIVGYFNRLYLFKVKYDIYKQELK